MLDKIAPKDPTAKRPGFYVLLDKPVGGLPSNDGVGHHPVYINGDRLVTFAKMVGGIDDENILEMLRTAKGFRKLVHSVGVSIVGDLPDKVVTFTLGFSGELGSGGSRNSMKITTDGTEHIMVMDEQQAAQQDDGVARGWGLTTDVPSGGSAYNSADFHSLCNIALVIKFCYLTCCKTDLVTV